MPMIEMKSLRKSYASLEVLKGVSFDVDKGEVVVVLGPSGSGKSTMLRCINHLEEYEAGDILIDETVVGYSTDIQGRRVPYSEAVNAKMREQVGWSSRASTFPASDRYRKRHDGTSPCPGHCARASA